LLVKDVRPMGGPRVDLLVEHGRIRERRPGIVVDPSVESVDGGGRLLLPGLVDGHMHLDKTHWGLPWRPHQAGPRIIDRIETERRLRAELGLSPAVQSARLARQAIGNGTTHIRTHVDVDTEVGLAGLGGLVDTRKALAAAVTMQIVAFPQSGVVIRPGTRELLEEAVRQGADLVGGLDPAGIDGDPRRQLDAVFSIAERHGVGVDIHLHDPGELGAFQVELIAERTSALGLQGRVAISHAFCLGMVEGDRFAGLVERLVDNRVAIMTHAPGDRAFPPIRPLRAAGVTLFSGSDGIRDAWTPFGNGDMLERAMLLCYRSAFRRDEDIHLALEMVTAGGAAVMGVPGYGLEIDCQADFVVVDGDAPAEAVVNRPRRSLVVKGGRIVARDGVAVV
jgi:cytosine/adenosine deaminase-related metal-dependent hydrolase